MFKITSILVAMSCFAFSVLGQNIKGVKIDSSFRTTYYEQKVSLFKSLPDEKDEIVFLGNSITDIAEWAELFQNPKIKNRGISGDNTFGVLNRLQEVTSSKPSKIFLMVGINDLAQNIPKEVIINNYTRIVSNIKSASPETIVYLQSVLPTNKSFTEFKRHQDKDESIRFLNQNLQTLALSTGCVFINLYSHFLDAAGKLDKKYTNDGLHLTAAGYLLWKEILKQNNYL